MDIIYITIPVTLLFIATGVLIFFWASKSGQFDDLEGPAHRILFDEDYLADFGDLPPDQKAALGDLDIGANYFSDPPLPEPDGPKMVELIRSLLRHE